MPPTPTDHMLSLYRTTVQSTTELMNVYLQGIEHMQHSRHAMAALNEARSETNNALDQIRSADSLQDLYRLQTRLGRTQIEKIVTYWTSLYATANLNQLELVRQVQIKVLALVDTVSQSLDGTQPTVPEPMVNAMKMAVDAARSSYAATVRAAEQAALEAAAQIELAAARQENAAQSTQAAA